MDGGGSRGGGGGAQGAGGDCGASPQEERHEGSDKKGSIEISGFYGLRRQAAAAEAEARRVFVLPMGFTDRKSVV